MKRVFCFILFAAYCLCASAALPPSLAFKPTVSALDSTHISVHFTIANQHYLYRDKFHFKLEAAIANSENVDLAKPEFPAGEVVDDGNFGRVTVYYNELRIQLPVERPANTLATPLALDLRLTWQGCAQDSLCYPPQTQTFSLELPSAATSASALIGQATRERAVLSDSSTHSPLAPLMPRSANAATEGNLLNESGRIVHLLQEASWWTVVLSFLGFGLLLSFTPCVWPTLPILSSLIVGAEKTRQVAGHCLAPWRALRLSLVYVLGMSVTTTSLGVIAGFTGTMFSTFLQTPLFLSLTSALLALMALALFGQGQVAWLNHVMNALAERTHALRGGKLAPVFLMGMLSAVLCSTCIVVPLAGALLFIGQTGNALLGGLALFSLSLGMGLPLLLIGSSAGHLLPKSGAWMRQVQKILGFLLLATALWTLSPLLSELQFIWLWIILIVLFSVSLLMPLLMPDKRAKNTAYAFVRKGVGILFLLYGACLIVGALAGSHDPWSPLAVLHTKNSAPLTFTPVRSVGELEQLVKNAKQPMLLEFYADWCKECKVMERQVFADPRVREALLPWQLLRADISANTPEDQALLAYFDLYGPPAVLFFKAGGGEVNTARVIGLQKAERFLANLQRALP